MNNAWAFLPMRDSTDLLGDPDALRQRLDEDSYLYLKNILDPDRISTLRRRILLTLADQGWIRRKPYLMRGVAISPPVREGDEDFLRVYDEVQRLEEFHALAHDEALMDVMRQVLGESAFPASVEDRAARLPGSLRGLDPAPPGLPNNQGTPNLTAAWIPVGDCPMELGGLAVLRGSHHYGVLPLDTHLGAGNRSAVVPPQMLEALRWVSADYSAGDVVLFRALTVHAALHNASEFFMRLSVDFRYQQEGEALTETCLQPHFGRLSWDDIYSTWKSDRHQYYWKDLDYEVVPFEEFDLVRSDAGERDDVEAFLAYERRRDARFRRRTERLAAMLDPGADRSS